MVSKNERDFLGSIVQYCYNKILAEINERLRQAFKNIKGPIMMEQQIKRRLDGENLLQKTEDANMRALSYLFKNLTHPQYKLLPDVFREIISPDLYHESIRIENQHVIKSEHEKEIFSWWEDLEKFNQLIIDLHIFK